MNPTWLVQVLAENAHLNLDHPDGRALMAERIAEAIPIDVVTAAIRESVRAVLVQKKLLDDPTSPLPRRETEDLVRELGNNAAQSVLLMLQVGDEPAPASADECDDCNGNGHYFVDGKQQTCICSELEVEA